LTFIGCGVILSPGAAAWIRFPGEAASRSEGRSTMSVGGAKGSRQSIRASGGQQAAQAGPAGAPQQAVAAGQQPAPSSSPAAVPQGGFAAIPQEKAKQAEVKTDRHQQMASSGDAMRRGARSGSSARLKDGGQAPAGSAAPRRSQSLPNLKLAGGAASAPAALPGAQQAGAPSASATPSRAQQAAGVQPAAASDPAAALRGQLATKHSQMTRLEHEMASLDATLEGGMLRGPEKTQAEARRRAVMGEYNQLRDERRAAGAEIGRLGHNPVVELARPDELPKGTVLYSVQSPEKLKRIVQEGVGFLEHGPAASTYDTPELGRGFYADTTGGAYRMDNKPMLVLRTADSVGGVATRPFEEMRRAGQFDSPVIDQGQTALRAQNHAYLRHEGLPPENTELVLRPQGMPKVQIVGVIENPPLEGPPPMDRMTPIQDWARTNGLRVHPDWAKPA
jgi:hypothetical protein